MLSNRSALWTLVALGLTAFAAHPASAQSTITVLNPSFELNQFAAYPGYVNQGGNGVIQDWTSNNNDSGLNPAGGSSPFADNGAIPDGKQVAFLQSDRGVTTTLSQMLSGFTAGDQYQVSFYDNRRSYDASDSPVLGLSLGGQTLLSQTITTPVFGTAPYNFETSGIYTASTSGPLNLVFSSKSLNGTDTTSLIDNVKITNLGPASAAPEPSQLGMLALAALGLGALALKARKRIAAPQAA